LGKVGRGTPITRKNKRQKGIRKAPGETPGIRLESAKRTRKKRKEGKVGKNESL